MANAPFAWLPNGWIVHAQCMLFVLLVTVDINQQATPTAFANCPPRCRCDRNTTYIQCGGLNLTSVLQDLPSTVHILFLSDNRIEILHNGSFDGLTKLTSLTLNDNRISQVEVGSFAPLINIRVLQLSANRIQDIDADAFETNNLLTEIDLSDNVLTSVDAHLFNYLMRLRILNLARNRLTSFAGGTFAGLGLLRTLNIAGNSITVLESGIFTSLLSLVCLNISQMALQSLDISAFPFPSAVQILDASGNSLKTFASLHFDRFHNIRHLNLSTNPLACDCRAVALRRWLGNTHFGVVPSTARRSTFCAQPQSRAGLALFQFPLEELTCAKNRSKTASQVVIRHYNVIEPSRYANGYTLNEYDPKIGWYTAATLSAMLIGFLLCIALDKLKRMFIKRRKEHSNNSRGQSVVRKPGAPPGGDQCSDRSATVPAVDESRSRVSVERIEAIGKHRKLGFKKVPGHMDQNRSLDCGCQTPLARCDSGAASVTGKAPRRARSHDESCRSTPRSVLARQASSLLPRDHCRQTSVHSTADDLAEFASLQPLSVNLTAELAERRPFTADTSNNAHHTTCDVSSDSYRWRYRAVSPTPSVCVEMTGVTLTIPSRNDQKGLLI